MQWEVVIGFETHAQLKTNSKIFSGSSIQFGAEPNTQASPVDLALPGVLPVMNKGAVQRAIEFGLAIGSHIAPKSIFARKNYFYPDLPKGYQISQFEIPVVQGGAVEFFMPDAKGVAEKKTVRLVRAHLEEDAGKSLHEDFAGMSGIDLNRAGDGYFLRARLNVSLPGVDRAAGGQPGVLRAAQELLRDRELAVADRLAQREGEFHPFDRSGPFALAYARPEKVGA